MSLIFSVVCIISFKLFDIMLAMFALVSCAPQPIGKSAKPICDSGIISFFIFSSKIAVDSVSLISVSEIITKYQKFLLSNLFFGNY